MRSPHSNWPVSSTCLVDTPARYMSISASSTLSSRLQWRSITADPNRAPFNFGALSSSLPALAVRLELVVAGPIRLPSAGTLVSRGVGDLVRLGVEHRVDDPLGLLAHHGVELALEHGPVEPYDFLGHGSVSLSNHGFSLSGG